MQKCMHFFKVRALKQVDGDDGEKLPAQKVSLIDLLDEVYLRTNRDRDLSTLRKKIQSRELALTIYYSDGRFYKGRFCIIKDGPLSEGVIENDDGSEEIGFVYAQDNTRLIFRTVAFVYDAERNLIGLSMNCNNMLQDYLNTLNNEQDYGIDEVIVTQDEIVFGVDTLTENEFINSLFIEIAASKAKSIEGESWIADYIRPLGNLDREAIIGIKITPEITAGGDVMTITKQALGEFWESNRESLSSLEVNPNRKGGFKFGSQNHVKQFDVKKDGDVLDAAELNDKSVEYLSS